jgi:hypothetical protein
MKPCGGVLPNGLIEVEDYSWNGYRISCQSNTIWKEKQLNSINIWNREYFFGPLLWPLKKYNFHFQIQKLVKYETKSCFTRIDLCSIIRRYLMIILFIALFSLPFILIYLSFIDVKTGKRDKINWKLPILTFTVLMAGSVIAHLYFLTTYDLPIFVSSTESIILFSIIGGFLAIFAFVNIILTLTSRKTNLSNVHNSKTIWQLIGGLVIALPLLLFWFIPIAEKSDYVSGIHKAIKKVESSNSTDAFSIVLVRSEKDCIRVERCTNKRYDNQFFIKNNLDELKEVQVFIHSLNKDREELKVIESNVMRMEPGELALLETEETGKHSSLWSRYSFKTDERVSNYQYQLQYHDIGNVR